MRLASSCRRDVARRVPRRSVAQRIPRANAALRPSAGRPYRRRVGLPLGRSSIICSRPFDVRHASTRSAIGASAAASFLRGSLSLALVGSDFLARFHGLSPQLGLAYLSLIWPPAYLVIAPTDEHISLVFHSESGAPGKIRTPNPQIRRLAPHVDFTQLRLIIAAGRRLTPARRHLAFGKSNAWSLAGDRRPPAKPNSSSSKGAIAFWSISCRFGGRASP